MSTRGTTLPRTADWSDQADCRLTGMDPELWFPRGTTGPYVLQADEAKAFCHECPVGRACATWAIKKRVPDGIYGGLTEKQRLRIARKAAADDLTDQQITQLVEAVWARDTRNPLVDTYLDKSIQGDDGHVWWRGTKHSVTVAGRVLTPAQIAFEVGHNRRPEGHVKALCDQPHCVAAEHLADTLIRWTRNHPNAA